MKRTLAAVTLLFCLQASAHATDAVQSGQFRVERPTLLNLGFDWDIAGDDNRNAAVEVEYRQAGTEPWKTALPLLRMGGERVFRVREHLDYVVPNRFAGSVLNLHPDTEYEVRLTMKDPDGVEGQAIQNAKVRTRAEPKEATGGRVLHVYPPDWRGDKIEPSFTGLKEAYYGSGRGDWSVVYERKVGPGDVILIHAGLYKGDRLDYVTPLGIPFDGTYVLSAKGTPERPIVIRAAGDGEVIFDGADAHELFNVMAADYNLFEGLTIRNVDIAFQAGYKDVLGAKGLTVRNCRMENVGMGVTTEYAGSRDFYIADNVLIGRKDRYRLQGWSNPGIYGPNPLKSYYAIRVYGSGHVVAHNAIAFFHDAIGVSTHGSPDPRPEDWATSIDIYNNDMHLMADDFIEADGGVHNIRVFNNRGVNAAHCALSGQPIFGGPAYYFRNVVYHIGSGPAFKFMAKPAGLIVYHNTVISENRMRDLNSNAHFRNNLFLGTDSEGRNIASFPNATSYSSFDYDGYRPNRGVEEQYVWLAPEKGKLRDYELDMKQARAFKTLRELTAATGQETHGIEIDYDVFANLPQPEPNKPHAVYYASDLDFRLNPNGKAVDAGVVLPTVNDDFSGKAPDLGALEVGRPVPVYGPRGASKHPFYQ
jgi:hypothetical protein